VNIFSNWLFITFVLVATTSLAGAAEVVSSSSPAIVTATSADNNLSPVHIRTLAASCAACHGTQGNSAGSTPSLAGLDNAYFSAQMLAFKQGKRTGLVMQRHAIGLNEDEVRLLATYFSNQKRTVASVLKSQVLKSNHGN
jgi:cytochrome subunit of sulfide dehydrogenase